MSDAAPFLAAVRAHPDDDAPRLVYADWLDERGDADRAEFIRVQCELAPLDPADPHAATLKRRERGLLARHERAWVGDLAGVASGWTFARGFVDYLLLV